MASYIFSDILPKETINEIGRYLNFEMWDDRDTTKTYSYPYARGDEDAKADDYIDGSILEYNCIPLLIFKYVGEYHGAKSLYTLNLLTLTSTKNSHIQTILNDSLKQKIKNILNTKKSNYIILEKK